MTKTAGLSSTEAECRLQQPQRPHNPSAIDLAGDTYVAPADHWPASLSAQAQYGAFRLGDDSGRYTLLEVLQPKR